MYTLKSPFIFLDVNRLLDRFHNQTAIPAAPPNAKPTNNDFENIFITVSKVQEK